MKYLKIDVLFFLLFIIVSCNAKLKNSKIPNEDSDKELSRNPLKQPFNSNSIWNMPIGNNAKYVHAEIEKAMAAGMTIDEDIIVIKPEAPETEIYTNYAGWNR